MDSFTGTTFEADREESDGQLSVTDVKKFAILIIRKKVFFMNFLVMVNSQQHYTSALVTVQATFKEETDKETIWIVETCSC